MIARALALILTIPAALASQSPSKAATRDGVMSQFEIQADLFGSRLVAAFDSIPASRYGYAPTPSQQTVGYIAQHLEAANYDLCGLFGNLKHPGTAKDAESDSAKARWPKDTLVTRLAASLKFCDSALERTPHVNSAELANYLLRFVTDLAEHYSQISSYMRMLGLVPPSALPPRHRTAIVLSSAELAGYVGAYELPEGTRLKVALRDGGLAIQSSLGGPPVSIAPERKDEFFATVMDVQVTFTRDAAGKVTGLVVHRFGRDSHAKLVASPR